MKNSFSKTLRTLLALVLILSVLPMAAFATEVDTHEHSASCCAESGNVMPASIVCPDGTHIYTDMGSVAYTDCGGVHRVDQYKNCAKCGAFSPEPTSSYYEAHAYTKTVVGTDPDSGLKIYCYSCACGNSYYGN